jgi:lysophospholipase L1-like esterase
MNQLPSTVRRRAVLTGLASAPLAATAATTAAAEAGPTPSPIPPRTIYIAGDSTAAPKVRNLAPETGWGMALPYFLADRITVANQARNGRSSKSFVDEGRLEVILGRLRPGDVLLVQFGHNDQKAYDAKRYTEPWTTYQSYLSLYVDGARSKGAIPVWATSAERRRFNAVSNAYTTLEEYPDGMRALAAAMDVPLVDVHTSTLGLWQKLGPDETAKYFRPDNTHFTPRGAAAVAEIVAIGLLDTGVVHRGDLRALNSVPPDSWFTWLDKDPDA